MTLKFLGGNPIVLTKLNISDHNILSYLKDRGITCHWWSSKTTTYFQNIYEHDAGKNGREQKLLADADPITLQEVKDIIEEHSWIIATPLTQNFIPISMLKHYSKNNCNISLALQGYLRESKNKQIKIKKHENLGNILTNCKTIFLDRVEAKSIVNSRSRLNVAKFISKYGPKEVIITDGTNGGLYYSKDVHFTYKVPRISRRDPTGAGDVFMSSYLYMKSENAPPRECIEFAVDSTFKLLEKRIKIFNYS